MNAANIYRRGMSNALLIETCLVFTPLVNICPSLDCLIDRDSMKEINQPLVC